MNDNNEMNDAETTLEYLRQKHGKGKTMPTEEPPKDLGATDNEPDADPEDTTEKPEDSPESGRKKTRNGPFKRVTEQTTSSRTTRRGTKTPIHKEKRPVI